MEWVFVALAANVFGHMGNVMEIGIAMMGVTRPTQLVGRIVVEWRIAFAALVASASLKIGNVTEIKIVKMAVTRPTQFVGRIVVE